MRAVPLTTAADFAALLPAELSRRKFATGRLARVFDAELVTEENYTLLLRAEDDG